MITNKIAVINYGCGNTNSIVNMLKHVGGEVFMIDKAEDLKHFNIIIMPGVGSFDHGISKLKENNFFDILNEIVFDKTKTIVGICLGMQLMFETSEEGSENGLGWIKGSVKSLQNFIENDSLKVPHMGWNNLIIKKNKPLLKNLDDSSRFYFTHSYYCNCQDKDDVIAETNYGDNFVSAINKNNIYGFQFHPEKSHKYGKIIFKNLINLANNNA